MTDQWHFQDYLEQFKNLRSLDPNVSQEADRALRNKNPIELALNSAIILNTDGLEIATWRLAATLIGSVFSSCVPSTKQLYYNLSPSDKNVIKTGIFRGLMIDDIVLQRSSALSLAWLSNCEFFFNSWLEIFDHFNKIMTDDQYSPYIKRGVIIAYKELVEKNSFQYIQNDEIRNEVLRNVFSTFIDVLRDAKSSLEIKEQAILGLGNFITNHPKIFQSPSQLKDIFYLLIKCISFPDPSFHTNSYSALLAFFKEEYQFLNQDEITTLFRELFKSEMESGSPLYQKISFDFWSSFATFESQQKKSNSKNILSLVIFPYLTQVFQMYKNVIVQEMTDDPSISLNKLNYNLNNEPLFETMLNFFSTLRHINDEQVFAIAQEYFNSFYQNENWILRYSSFILIKYLSHSLVNKSHRYLSRYSELPLEQFISNNINNILGSISDPIPIVRYLVFELIGKFIRNYPGCFSTENIEKILLISINLLEEEPMITLSAFNIIQSFTQSIATDRSIENEKRRIMETKKGIFFDSSIKLLNRPELIISYPMIFQNIFIKFFESYSSIIKSIDFEFLSYIVKVLSDFGFRIVDSAVQEKYRIVRSICLNCIRIVFTKIKRKNNQSILEISFSLCKFLIQSISPGGIFVNDEEEVLLTLASIIESSPEVLNSFYTEIINILHHFLLSGSPEIIISTSPLAVNIFKSEDKNLKVQLESISTQFYYLFISILGDENYSLNVKTNTIFSLSYVVSAEPFHVQAEQTSQLIELLQIIKSSQKLDPSKPDDLPYAVALDQAFLCLSTRVIDILVRIPDRSTLTSKRSLFFWGLDFMKRFKILENPKTSKQIIRYFFAFYNSSLSNVSISIFNVLLNKHKDLIKYIIDNPNITSKENVNRAKSILKKAKNL